MSRRLPGSSGGSHSFGGGSVGGSRSFGGSHGGGPRQLSGGTSSGSSPSSGGSFRGSGDDLAGGILTIAGFAFSIFDFWGVIISIYTLIIVIFFMHYPVVGGILLGVGVTILILISLFGGKKRTAKCNLVELVEDKEKYDPLITESDDFRRHMLCELRERDLLTKRGDLDKHKTQLAIECFDEIYEGYLREHDLYNDGN